MSDDGWIDPATIPARRTWCRHAAGVASAELRGMEAAGEATDALAERARSLMAATEAAEDDGDDPDRIDGATLEFLEGLLALYLDRARRAAELAASQLGQGSRASRRGKSPKAAARKAKKARYWVCRARDVAGLQSIVARRRAARDRSPEHRPNGY